MPGGLEVQSIRKLNQLARGEVSELYYQTCPVFAHKTAIDVAQDAYSPYYNMAADALITLGTFLYQTLFQI